MTPWSDWREAPPCDFAVIGLEVGHSRSPRMHEAAYRALGLDLSYRAVRVGKGEMEEALGRLASLGCQGVNVTVGLKEEALEWAKERGGTEGEESGVLPRWGANTLSLESQTAISTDELGFLRALESCQNKEASGPVLLLGAGGTGRALAHRLTEEGREVWAWNRTPGRWEELGLSIRVLDQPSLSGVAAVVNCTSAGLHGGSLPLNWEEASKGLLAMDLVYGMDTPFLLKAREAGVRAVDGSRMLMEQGAVSFEWWLRAPAPREAMLEAILDGDSQAHP